MPPPKKSRAARRVYQLIIGIYYTVNCLSCSLPFFTVYEVGAMETFPRLPLAASGKGCKAGRQ